MKDLCLTKIRISCEASIAESLAASHPGEVLGIEPNISELPDSSTTSALKFESTEQALLTADVYLLLVDHRQFRRFNPSRAGKVVVDTRGIWAI